MTKNAIWFVAILAGLIALGLWFQQQPMLRAPVGMEPSATSLDFGKAYIGTTVKQQVTWINQTNQLAAVQTYGANQPPFNVDQASAPLLPLNVAPGQSTPALMFTFSPTAKGNFTGRGNILVLGGIRVTRVDLKGEGVYSSASGALSLQIPAPVAGATSPEFVDFGRVMVGQAGTKIIEVHNAAAQNVNANANSSVFTAFAITNPNNPVAVPANGSVQVTLAFTPMERKEYWGVVLFSDPSNSANYTAIVVRGEGVSGQ